MLSTCNVSRTQYASAKSLVVIEHTLLLFEIFIEKKERKLDRLVPDLSPLENVHSMFGLLFLIKDQGSLLGKESE